MGAAVDQHKRGRESVSDLLKREKKTGAGFSREDFSGANNHNRLMRDAQDLFGADRR